MNLGGARWDVTQEYVVPLDSLAAEVQFSVRGGLWAQLRVRCRDGSKCIEGGGSSQSGVAFSPRPGVFVLSGGIAERLSTLEFGLIDQDLVHRASDALLAAIQAASGKAPAF